MHSCPCCASRILRAACIASPATWHLHIIHGLFASHVQSLSGCFMTFSPFVSLPAGYGLIPVLQFLAFSTIWMDSSFAPFRASSYFLQSRRLLPALTGILQSVCNHLFPLFHNSITGLNTGIFSEKIQNDQVDDRQDQIKIYVSPFLTCLSSFICFQQLFQQEG